MKIRSVKIHGGKYFLAEWIINNFPKNYTENTYVEPFGGAANVLLQKLPSVKEIYNDLDPSLSSIFHYLKTEGEELCNKLNEMDYSEGSFNWAISRPKEFMAAEYPFTGDMPTLEATVAEIVARRMSRGGLKTAFSWSERLRGGEPGDVHAWKTFKEQLPQVCERLKHVEICCGPATELIKLEDSKDTLFYLDPPYLPKTRTATGVYQKEMTEKEHCELADLLKKVQGKVILSGYYSQLYNKLYKGWRMEVKEMPNHSSQSKKKERRLECLYINY